MATAHTNSMTIKELERAIIHKAREENANLKQDFYSYDVGRYEFVDINTFQDYKLLFFRCPKSKSTLSIKVSKRNSI